MDKKFKIIVISIVAILMVGIFIGKNIYEKKEQLADSAENAYFNSLDDAKEGIPTILMFKSSTCQYCVELEKRFKKVSEIYPDKFNLVYIQVDDSSKENEKNLELAAKYKVRVVPTTIFIDSKEVDQYRIEGLMEEENILKILKEFGVE